MMSRNMRSKAVLTLAAGLLIAGCGSYDAGYEDGYEGAEKKWILIGENEYNDGYDEGAFDADCDYWKEKDYARYVKNCR